MSSEPEDPFAAMAAKPADDEAHPILTAEEVAAAKARAHKRIDDERRKAAMKAVEDQETQRLKVQEGFTTGIEAKDEMVKVTIDLAEHSDRIVVNYVPYWHGQTYTVPRHVADTLREIMARGWRHQDEIDGKDLQQHYQRKRDSVVSGKVGVVNAPSAMA